MQWSIGCEQVKLVLTDTSEGVKADMLLQWTVQWLIDCSTQYEYESSHLYFWNKCWLQCHLHLHYVWVNIYASPNRKYSRMYIIILTFLCALLEVLGYTWLNTHLEKTWNYGSFEYSIWIALYTALCDVNLMLKGWKLKS